MNQFVAWWKKDQRVLTLLKAVLLALLPVLCCLVYSAMQGKSIGEVYLPNSEWNDELFYYKQVEGIVKYGYPQGYFGFNESRALKLSFAAWSPVLVFPWILWGILFGWNLMSPIICNILLMTLACFLFVWLVRPTWRQLGILTFLFCLYTLNVRYMLSGMPEVICFALLIIFYGLAVNFLRREKGWKLAMLFVLSGLLTLMRPYMLLFMLLPAYLWIRRKKWAGIIGSGVIFVTVLGIYAMIKHYLGAEYFTPLFYTDWITTFFQEGIGAGFYNFFGTLYWKGSAFYGHTVEGVRSGLASGAFFGGYLVMMAVLLGQSLADYFKIRGTRRLGVVKISGSEGTPLKDKLLIEGHLAFSFVVMLLALLLMYKITEGSKHLLTFLAVGIFVVSLMETRTFKKAILLGAVFAYFYTYKAVDPYDYQVPYITADQEEQVEFWRETLADKLVLKRENVPSYENVVIWTLGDQLETGSVATKWQLLYALPEGMGISCCEVAYVMENFDALQSRYIAAPSGGVVDRLCAEHGYVELGRDVDLVVYERE